MHFSPEDMQYDTEFMARCRFVLVMRSMSAARDENTIFPAVFHPSNALDAAVALVNYEHDQLHSYSLRFYMAVSI
jgi:hypothetical protein